MRAQKESQNRIISKHSKAVCINATPLPDFTYPDGSLIKGNIYHVTKVKELHNGIGYKILGCRIFQDSYGGETYHASSRFKLIE